MRTDRRGMKASKVMCITLLMLMSVLAVLGPSAKAADWTKKDMGSIGGQVNGVTTGDGDNDGHKEVYTASSNGAVNQYRTGDKNPEDWKINSVGFGDGQSFYMYGIAVGDGRDSGSNAVYAGGFDQNQNGKMYEFNYDKGDWKKTAMGSGGWGITDVAMGDGKNNGRTAIYGSSCDGKIYEYTYSNGWNAKDIGFSSYYQTGVTVGDCNNDGKNEVYSVTYGYYWWWEQHVYMYTYSSSTQAWSTTDLGTNPGYAYGSADIACADGNNDGNDELFITTYQDTYMIKYDSGSWDWQSIYNNGNLIQNQIAVGDGDGDNQNEVYNSADNFVYRVVYSSKDGTWFGTSIGSGADGGILYGLAVGDGDDCGSQKEVYAGSSDGHVYQFKWDVTPPPNPRVWSPTHKPGQWSNISNVIVMWKIPPDPSGIIGYSWDWTTDASTVPDNKVDGKGGVDRTESGVLADGNGYYFHIRAEDGAGNWNESAMHFGPLMIDTVSPTNVNFKINDDAAYTNKRLVSLMPTGTDERSGMGYMAFSDDGAKFPAFDAWEAWTTPRTNWDLTDMNWGGNDNDGVKTVYMKARDNAGNQAIGIVSDTIFLDRQLPVGLSLRINDGADYANKGSVSLNLTASDPDPASGLDQMRFSNDGTTWGAWEPWSVVKNGWSLTADAGGSDVDGKKLVYFQVIDKAGNIAGPMFDDIYLDRAAPGSLSIIINGGAQYTNVTDVMLNVTAVDAVPGSGLDKMQFSNDATTYSSWEDFTTVKNPWSLTLAAGGTNADGVKPVYLQVKDKVGNLGGPVKSTIFLDRKSPTNLKMLINEGASLTNSQKVTLNMSATDPDPGSGIDIMRIKEEGSGWSAWLTWQNIYPFTLSAGDGSKTVCFMVKDKATNSAGPVCSSIVLDTSPPVLSNIKVISITDKSAIVTWSTDSPADGVVDYGTTTAYGSQQKDAAFLTAHGITLSGLTPTTTYHFRVASTDEVGNGPTISGDYTFTTTSTPDTTPPMITNLRVEGITDSLAIVLWDTNEPANSHVLYGTTTSYGLIAGSDQNVQTHSVTLLGLNPDTTYYVEAQSTDPSNNGPTNLTTQFRTKITPDKTPPVISNIRAEGITDKLAVIRWDTDEVATSIVEYGTTPTYGKVITDTTFTKEHMVTLSGLSPATTYYFIVRSTDPSDNGPTTSAQYTFQTSVTPDTTPPAISDVKSTGVTNTMAIILWNTDELADGVVEYWTIQPSARMDEIGYKTAHSVTLTGLKGSTIYHYHVLSKDMSGNGPTKSTDYTFTTLAVQDKEPPIISDAHVEGVSSSVAVVIWKTNEVADSQVDFGLTLDYGGVQRDAIFVTAHSVVIKGLNASTTYHVRVKSTDPSGNGPTISADFIFSTTAIVDKTPPNVTGLTYTDVTANSAKITWLTDEPANTLLRFGTNGSQNSQAGDELHYTTNHTWTLSGLEPGTTYSVKVLSSDPSGNTNVSAKILTFTTKKKTVTPPPGPGPNPISGNKDWPWILLILALAIGGAVGGIYVYTRRKTGPTPPYSARTPRRGGYAAGEETYNVEEMQMDEGDVQTVDMGDEGAETMEMEGDGEVQTLDMGDEGGDVELGAAITAITSAPAARPRKPVRTVKCPGCRSAIPIYSETQTDIRCPQCGKEGRIKPMKAPPPEEDAGDLTPLGSVLGAEPDLPPPPKAPSRPPKAAARPKAAAPPPKVPLKTLTCSGCSGKVPIYTTQRPLKITCPNCGKSGTLKN